MQQRVSRNEYNEWKTDFITKRLFDFFKLEAELNRRALLEVQQEGKTFEQIGEEYTKRAFAAYCYDSLSTIDYLDLFPEELDNESN
jgi:hypothetical protein